MTGAMTTPAGEKMFKRIMRKPAAPLVLGLHTGGNASKIDDARMWRYVEAGMTGQQAADAHLHETGIALTRAAVSYWKKKHGVEGRRVNPHMRDLVPWRIAAEHAHDRLIRALRTEASLRANFAVNEPDLQRHAAVVRELREGDWVIHYDRVNGAVLVPRRKGVDKDMIRDPRIADDGTAITDESLWRS